MHAAGITSWSPSLTNPSAWGKMESAGIPAQLTCGPVAQLGARFHGMEEVVGSIPTRSTIKSTTYKNLLSPIGSIW